MSVATTFVHDTFTDSDNSLLLLHQPEVGGPVKLLSSYPGSLTDPPTCTGTVSNLISYTIVSNRATPTGTGGGANAGVYYDATPSSADYDLYFTVVVPTPFSTDSYHGVLFRVNTANGDHYRLQYRSYVSFHDWKLTKRVSGVESAVGSNASQSLTAGATYRFRLSVVGSTFTLYDVTSGSPGTTIGTWTDSSLSSAGKVGLFANWGTSSIVFDEFRACNAGTSAEDYTLDGPAWPSQTRGIPGAQSGSFTVTLQGSNAGPVTITPGASGAPGTFSPTTVTLSGLGASGTFKFTPSALTSAPATATVAVTNNAGLNDPGTVSYAVDYADLYGKSVWVDSITNAAAGPVGGTGPNYPTDPTVSVLTGNDQYQGLRDLYRVVQNVTGGTAFNRSIDVSRIGYRANYGAIQGGQLNQIVNYVWQNLNDYYEFGNSQSREFAILTSRWSPYARQAPSWLAANTDNYSTQMREIAYCVLSKSLMTRLGYANAASPVATVHRYCQSLMAQLDDYMAGPGNRTANNNTSQFYVGLAFQGLIAYWNQFITDGGTAIPDSLNVGQTVLQLAQSIPAKIKLVVDWMMSSSRSQAISNVANNGGGLYRLTVPDTSNWTTGKKVLVLSTGVSALDNKFWTVTVVNGTTLDLQGSTYASGWVSGGMVNPPEWNTSTLSFAYRDDMPTDTPSTAIDYGTWVLNGDFIGGPAWYYQWSARVNGSREPVYRDYAEQIFRGSYPVSLQGTNHGVCISNKEWTECHYQMPAALDWISQGDTAWATATGLTCAPPATLSGAPGMWSGDFKVTLSGGRVPASSGLPVTVTPSDGSAGGTFLPASCNISADFPTCAFRYRPANAAAGTNVSVSFSASGLTGTGTSTYAVTATPATTATGLTITGPTSVVTGRWTQFTLSLSPANSALPSSLDAYGSALSVYLNASVSPNDTPLWIHLAGDAQPSNFQDGGRYLTLSGERPSQTFWFKAPSGGTWTLTAVAQEVVSWSAPGLTVTASGTATLAAIAMSGPSTGRVGRVSDFFNLVPDGPGTSSVSLSDGGAGGTFLPSSTVRWINDGAGYGGTYQPGAVAAFAYQAPASAGSVTISATATGATSPGSVGYTASGSGGSGVFVLQSGGSFFILAS